MNTEATATRIRELKNVKLTPEDIERFWSKVNKQGTPSKYCPEKGGCWPWTSGLFQSGYGQFKADHTVLRAHRVAFYLSHGYLPPLPEMVTHFCHNPKCCNPDHLKPGDALSNMCDKVSAGREARGLRMSIAVSRGARRGEDNARALLSNQDVRTSRELFATGSHRILDLSRMFGVSHAVMSHIIHRRSWRSVE